MLLQYAIDVCCGMEFLAKEKACGIITVMAHNIPQCVHRDLAARNILINDAYTAKVIVANWKCYGR